ncbi:MAG: hypothetical protein F4121_09845 [Acidimicrobiia bacterium]|nr:hypothetical protein [Acidimicrobiia bacterium]
MLHHDYVCLIPVATYIITFRKARSGHLGQECRQIGADYRESASEIIVSLGAGGWLEFHSKRTNLETLDSPTRLSDSRLAPSRDCQSSDTAGRPENDNLISARTGIADLSRLLTSQDLILIHSAINITTHRAESSSTLEE